MASANPMPVPPCFLVEDAIELFFGDAGAGVVDFDAEGLAQVPDLNSNLPLFSGEFHGIGEEVDEDLLQAVPIAPDHRLLGVAEDFQFDVLAFSQGADVVE